MTDSEFREAVNKGKAGGLDMWSGYVALAEMSIRAFEAYHDGGMSEQTFERISGIQNAARRAFVRHGDTADAAQVSRQNRRVARACKLAEGKILI